MVRTAFSVGALKTAPPERTQWKKGGGGKATSHCRSKDKVLAPVISYQHNLLLFGSLAFYEDVHISIQMMLSPVKMG